MTLDLLTAVRQGALERMDTAGDSPTSSREVLTRFTNATYAQQTEVISTLVQEAEANGDRLPNQARAFASVAHEFACVALTPREQAETALSLAIALNRLGEFAEARPLARQAADVFDQNGDQDKAASSLAEAAWVDTFDGDLKLAMHQMERARALTRSPLCQARCDWIQARILHSQAQYPQAVALLERACATFQQASAPLQAARCERELAQTYLRSQPNQAAPLLQRIRAIFESAECTLDIALCDYLLANSLLNQERYGEALELLLVTRYTLTKQRADFFAAGCDLTLGTVYRHLNRFEDSLRLLYQAREYYVSHGIRGLIPACDINLGGVLYLVNHYAEALARYQQAADLSMAEGRDARAGYIYINMGMVYAKQGLYSQALDLHNRALQIAKFKDLPFLAAGSHMSLAACYREVGQYAEALAHLHSAEQAVSQHSHHEGLIQNNIDQADIYLALGEIPQAVTCLEQARRAANENHLDSLVAACDRLLAKATSTAGRDQALARVDNARRLFRKHSQMIDAALCDLTEGELQLEWDERAAAQDCFERARGILSPAFPEQAWRAEYGLARCAAVSGQVKPALDHTMRAVRTIAAARSAIVTEQLSNDYFARHRSLYNEGIMLALRQDNREAALEIIEASKARTFLTLLQQRGWKIRTGNSDPYIADLVSREKHLRYQLERIPYVFTA